MSTINWTTDSASGFFVNLTGNLNSTGKIWSGNAGSPSGIWRINIDATCGVTQTVNPPHYNYDLHMGNVVVKQNLGAISTYDIYASGFGISSWGNPPPPAPYDAPPYLPRGWGWPFKFAKAGSPDLTTWTGSYFITLTRAVDAANFATWRYSMDIVVKGP